MTGKLTALIALLLAAPVIGAAASTFSQGDVPSHTTGDALNCPDGSSVQSEFRLDGDLFSVTGPLVSLDAVEVTVMGPSGDVIAALTLNAEVDAGLQPGTPVDVEGALFDQGTTLVASEVHSACSQAASDTPEASPAETLGPTPTPTIGADTATPTPEPADTPEPSPTDEPKNTTCNRGPGRAGELHLIIHGDRVDIKRGAVASFAQGVLTIVTPVGDVSVIIDADTKTKGDLSLAEEVMVKGTLAAGDVHAGQVKVLCPTEAHQASGHDDDEDDDDKDGAFQPSPQPIEPPLPSMAPDAEHGEDNPDDSNGRNGNDHGKSGHGDNGNHGHGRHGGDDDDD